MDTIKLLSEVIPPEKRILSKKTLADLVKLPLVVYGAVFVKTGETDYATATVSIKEEQTRFTVTANQTQIVDTLHYLDDNKLFPIRAMIAPLGKSYAIVDPVEEPTAPAGK